MDVPELIHALVENVQMRHGGGCRNDVEESLLYTKAFEILLRSKRIGDKASRGHHYGADNDQEEDAICHRLASYALRLRQSRW